LRTRESSRHDDKKESGEGITQNRRENTNQEDADRPSSNITVRIFECLDCVAGENSAMVLVITGLCGQMITTRIMQAGAELLCPQSILFIERMDQSGENPD